MKKLWLILTSLACVANAEVYVNVDAGADTSIPQIAYNANAGYMFNKYFGLEGGYTGVSDTSYWDAAVKGVLPIPFIDIYGKLGMSYQSDLGYSSGALLYGAGVSIPIFPMFQINVEDYIMSNQNPQNFLMAGLQFKF